MTLSLITACGANRVIGAGGRLAFRLTADRTWFEQQTAGRTLLLGRRSYEAWPGAGRDGRRPVVISSRPAGADWRVPAGDNPPRVATTVAAALAIARAEPGEIMVCGGQRVYEETLALADRLYLTEVQAEISGDRWFPDWRHLDWREVHSRSGSEGGLDYFIRILERVRRG